MELVISINVNDTAMPDEIDYALREAARIAGQTVLGCGRPQVDEQRNIGGALSANVACANGALFYRSE